MLYEYAVEPELLNTWERFRYFIEKFGVSQGRFISRYPKAWKRMVYQSLAGCSDMEKKRIEERLRQIDARLLRRQGTYDPNLAWLENAERECASAPFQAIIAASNPRNQRFVLDGDSLDESHALWNSETPMKVVRKAADMARFITPLLCWCSHVVFVDPHFGPENPRHRKPFEAFMAVLASAERRRPLLKPVEYHTGDKATCQFFQDACRRVLPELVPTGLEVRLVRWPQKAIHNRFILSDVGGVLVGQGLDEDEGAGSATDDWVRLDEATLAARWADFVANPTPSFVDEITIAGTKQ